MVIRYFAKMKVILIMRKVFLLAVIGLCLSSSLIAQIKVVHFKKLQQFLPTELLEFDRHKPSGSTQTAMGFTTSEATVEYNSKVSEKEGDTTVPVSIRVKISDVVFMPYAVAAFTMMAQQNMSSENENGYEKTISVKNTYPGKVSAQTGEYKSLKYEFGVSTRFLVELEMNGAVSEELMNKLIGSMDLETLAKTEGDK